jgi:hypothetical protein
MKSKNIELEKFKTCEISNKNLTQNLQKDSKKLEKPSGFKVIKKLKD